MVRAVPQKSTNIRRETSLVGREERERKQGHRAVTMWLTGLSGSGKSTLALGLERTLFDRGCAVYVLDGDNIRHGLSGDLGFSAEDRTENIRRIGEVAGLFNDAGMIVLCAFVSPFRADRDRLRSLMPEGDFIEVHVRASLEVCAARDPKQLYAKARSGEIKNFTGIAAPYEEPLTPDLVIDTEHVTPNEGVEMLVRHLEARGCVPRD